MLRSVLLLLLGWGGIIALAVGPARPSPADPGIAHQVDERPGPDSSSFFGRSSEPKAVYDEAKKVWTFGNDRVEVKLSYDPRKKGFLLTSFKDRKSGLELVDTPSSAGQLVVASYPWKRVLERSTALPKNGAPYSPELSRFAVSTKARYVRLMLENGDSKPDAYNNLAEVEVLADGKNIAAGKKASAHSETAPSMTAAKANDGVYHKDAPANCWSSVRSFQGSWWQVDLGQVHPIDEVRIQFREHQKKFANVPGAVTIFAATEASVAPQEQRIDLAEDFTLGSWTFTPSPQIKGGGVKTLAIEAVGVGKNAGITVTICYDVYPGNEPWTTKWFKISAPDLAKGPGRVLAQVVFDDFATGKKLAHAQTRNYKVSSLALTPAAAQPGHGVMVSNLNYSSDVQVTDGKIRVAYRPNFSLGEYLEATGQKTTRAFVGFWDGGSADAGEFQYQVFLVERHISVAPSTARPVVGFWPNAGHARDPATAKVAAQMGYAGIGFTSTGSWCEEGLRTGKLPPFADPANPKSFAATVLGAGLKPIFYIGENQLPLRTGIWPTRPAEAQALGKYLGKMSAATKANGWFIEDSPGENYQGFLGKDVPEIGRVDAMWREGIRVILGEIRAAVAPRPISLCRSWVKQLEVFDIQDFTLPFDTDDNYTWADKWMEAYQQRMPLQPNLAMMVCSPACVVNRNNPGNHAPPIAPRPGKSAREAADLDFVAARAANLGNVYHIESVSLTNATPEEIAIQKKWNTWHHDNREYLQYTQKLETSKPLPKNVYGLMHLRNEHHGKYGYLAWWNTQSTALTVAPRIDLPKWMLRIDPDKLVVKSVGSGKAVPFTVRGGAIQLDEVSTPMWSYEVLELSTR